LVMGTPSRAGMVLFDPPAITIMPGMQSVSFETRAVPEMLTSFDMVNVIFGSLEGLDISFQLDAEFPCHLCAAPQEQGIYVALTGGVGHDVGMGGINFSSTPWTNVRLGVLTVDTSTLIAGDVRQIIVSAELESQLLMDYPPGFASALGSGLMYEPLRGEVIITVLPEPATLLGLAMGLTAIFSVRRFRRRTTS